MAIHSAVVGGQPFECILLAAFSPIDPNSPILEGVVIYYVRAICSISAPLNFAPAQYTMHM